MPQLFLVMRTRGPAWNDGVTMDQQAGWRAWLAEDCWSARRLLQTLWINPWWLRLETFHP